MQRVKITLPAALTNLGPAIGALGLAVRLHLHVEFTRRTDHQVTLTSDGEDHAFELLEHPSIVAAMRVFQQDERAPSGFSVHIHNPLPLESGLGVEGALALGGVLGAANLLGKPYPREQLIHFAAQVTGDASGIAASLVGGLASATDSTQSAYFKALAAPNLTLTVVHPKIKNAARQAKKSLPRNIAYEDALFNLNRLPMFIDACQRSDNAQIAALLEDRYHTPHLCKLLPRYSELTEQARQAGALGLTFSGNSATLVAIATAHHQAIAQALQAALLTDGITSQAWVLPVDRQGVVLSLAQS